MVSDMMSMPCREDRGRVGRKRNEGVREWGAGEGWEGNGGEEREKVNKGGGGDMEMEGKGEKGEGKRGEWRGREGKR
jgi:hypothetical protein